MVDFNQKEIKIRSKSLLMKQFLSLNSNWTEIDDQIQTAWNPNR